MGVIAGLGVHCLYLDANILIYLLEDVAEYKHCLGDLVLSIDTGALKAVTSELRLLEGLTKPLSENRQDLVTAYLNQIQSSNGFNVVPIDRQILIEAAKVRATGGLKTPDAIHVATARLHGCDGFFTNDRHLSGITTPKAYILDDLPDK